MPNFTLIKTYRLKDRVSSKNKELDWSDWVDFYTLASTRAITQA
jgi:hypothetical protein